ncbi:MAG TPA: VOC family protein [Candidatus Sulfotelmatobacter sp.]|nr:VOC family protein [Candidatus Sulfotelmatobacter sp.]
MIDHVSISVDDFAKALAFYDAALAPLGVQRLITRPDHAGYGVPGRPMFWINHVAGQTGGASGHIAFMADDRAAVDAFHRAALAGGGRDNGAPGLRNYHPSYYGAFIVDPEGHRIEAVCHRPA